MTHYIESRLHRHPFTPNLLGEHPALPGTLDWLDRCPTERQLRAFVADSWRKGPAPLPRLCDAIEEVALFVDPDGDIPLIGPAVQLEMAGGSTWLVQHAPLGAEFASRLIKSRFPQGCDFLWAMLQSAPGLMGNSGLVFAHPWFFERPMEIYARITGGVEWTFEQFVRNETMIFDPDKAVCELVVKRPQVNERSLVIADASVRSYLYADDWEAGAVEIGASLDELLTLALLDPEQALTKLRRRRVRCAVEIPFRRPGEDARRAFDRCSKHEQAVMAIRVLRRVLPGCVRSPGMDAAVASLGLAEAALRRDLPLDRAVGESLADSWNVRTHHPDYLGGIATSIGNLCDVLAGADCSIYPQLPMTPRSTARPIYETIAEDLQLLDKLRPDTGDDAWRHLLDSAL